MSFLFFQGMKVHIEKPNIEVLIVNRKLLLELKEVSHHNLANIFSGQYKF